MTKLAQKIFLSSVLLFIYLPILLLIAFSFNKAHFSLQWQGASLQWYRELFADDILWRAFEHSVVLGLCAAFLACLIALFASIKHFLTVSTKSLPFHYGVLLLIIVPDIIFGLSLLMFFSLLGFPLGFWSLLIAHTSFCLPFALLSLNSRFASMDKNLYLAAKDLGASRFKLLTALFIPQLWPAILSAFLLSFTLSFDDVIISYFVAGPSYDILPLQVFSLVRAGVTPEINALCSIIICLSLLMVLLAHHLSSRKPS